MGFRLERGGGRGWGVVANINAFCAETARFGSRQVAGGGGGANSDSPTPCRAVSRLLLPSIVLKMKIESLLPLILRKKEKNNGRVCLLLHAV